MRRERLSYLGLLLTTAFSSRRRVILLCILLFGLVAGTFLPSLNNGFLSYDDARYITANSHVRSGLNWENIRWAFRATEVSNWHPLTWLSHMLDCSVFGMRAWGHHLTSVLLHATNTVLVFLFLWRATGAVWRSLFVAAIFGLHPLRVESVVWAAERKDVLSTLFWLLSILAYLRHAQKEPSVRGQVPGVRGQVPGVRGQVAGVRGQVAGVERGAAGFGHWTLDFGLAVLFFALGLLSKPMLVTLPFVLLLLDFWPLNRVPGVTGQVSGGRSQVSGAWGQPRNPSGFVSGQATGGGRTPNLPPDTPRLSTINSPLSTLFRRLVLEKLPFFALAAASCAVTLKVQRGAMIWMAKVPFLDRLGNALVSYWRYLGKLCWPAKLSVIYPVVDWPAQLVVLALLALLAVCVLAMVRWRPAPYFFTGWFWFIGTLIPVIGLVTVGEQSMADRYSYVPSIGVLIVLAWGAHDLSRHWHWQTAIFGTATIGVALACILITRQNIGYWKDTETLFRHATQSTDKNYRAFVNCGAALFNQGRVDEALRCFQEAVKSRPDSAEAHADLGVAWHAKNRPAEAIKEYQDAIRLRPGYAAAHVNLGIVLEENGQLDQAIQEFQQAIGLEPQALFYQRLGKVLSRRGRVEEAIAQLQQAVGLDPGNASIHDALGDVFRSNGRAQEAASQFQEALRLDPHDAAARSNLDLLLNAKNR